MARGGTASSRLVAPAAVLLAAQFVHLVVSATSSSFEDEGDTGEGVIGLPVGALFIVANVVVLVGLRRDREWAPQAAALVGFAVAVGFILYHGSPFHSWLTNPYWGAAGIIDWVGVAVCLVAGFWCAWAGWPRPRVPNRAVSS